MHELASCFYPYQLYTYDTLCTYGVKQFDFTAFWYARHDSNVRPTESEFSGING